jgi:hypothetical protein
VLAEAGNGEEAIRLAHSILPSVVGRVPAIGKSRSALFLAEGTVKNHVTNILGKLEVVDRTQAAIRAKDKGII